MKDKLAYIPAGTLVAVNVPDIPSTKMLQQFKGYCYRVKSWKHYTGGQYMYTLEECESRFGTPYWFADEWLREI